MILYLGDFFPFQFLKFFFPYSRVRLAVRAFRLPFSYLSPDASQIIISSPDISLELQTTHSHLNSSLVLAQKSSSANAYSCFSNSLNLKITLDPSVVSSIQWFQWSLSSAMWHTFTLSLHFQPDCHNPGPLYCLPYFIVRTF